MLSLASILNPSPPRAPPGCGTYSPPRSSSPEQAFLESSSVLIGQPMVGMHGLPRDIPVPAKFKIKGAVKFYPFEDLDDSSLREVRRFRVTPLGAIAKSCRHIPYNSGKKDFFEKTGRESFEVFQYTFKLPNDEVEYTVMWDYNVGLVRMTPFFKCCNYPKTTPAKMLNMNPGLRDITHSITGGSIMAQGYWMPFSCAKAVCATFCHHIAGALIPIFGPQFPSECVHPNAPDHGRMCIDPAVIAEATLIAEGSRRLYAEQASTGTPLSCRQQKHRRNGNYEDRQYRPYNTGSLYQGRRRIWGGRLPDSPYSTDMEEYDGCSGPELDVCGADYQPFHQSRYPYTPSPSHRAMHVASAPTSIGWTAENHENRRPGYQHKGNSQPGGGDEQYDHANPFLSALPRVPGQTPQSSPSVSRCYLPAIQPAHCNTLSSQPLLAGPIFAPSTALPTPVMSPKRPRAAFESVDNAPDADGDGGAGSHAYSSPTTSRVGPHGKEEDNPRRHQYSRSEMQLPPIGVSLTDRVAERNAALLLLNLSATAGRECVHADHRSDKPADSRPGGSCPWTSVLHKGGVGFESSQDDGPARKKRRTISL